MKRIRCHKKSSHKKKAEKILLVTAILNHVNSVMNQNPHIVKSLSNEKR